MGRGVFKNLKGADNDDDGIDDISEHSSDDIVSDSDGEFQSPLVKQIKKEKKRKKRKMEAIKKAQEAKKGGQ